MIRHLAFLLCVATVGASAGDLGTHGKLWPIGERDFRETFVEQASKVDWGQVNRDLVASVPRWLDSRPDFGLTPAAQSSTVWLDLTATLEKDISVPEFDEASGEYRWKVLYPKGTKVNPLDYQRPHDALVFFNANDPGQVEMARKLVQHDPHRWMLIQTAGNPATTTKQLGRPVFHNKKVLSDRFGLRASPAIVFAGHGEKRRLYGVSYLARPFSDEDLDRIRALAFPPRGSQP